MAAHNFSLSTCWEFIEAYPIPVLLFLITVQLFRNKYGYGLNQIPGPALAGYTKLWRVNNVRKGQAHRTMIHLHRKYGKVVRTAPNVIDVADPAMIPVIYNLKGEYTKVRLCDHNANFWSHSDGAFRPVSTQFKVFCGKKSRK